MGSSDFVRRSFSTFIFMDKRRVVTRAIAAFIADVRLPEKWAPLLFAKMGTVA
jgi:hypothetical protein